MIAPVLFGAEDNLSISGDLQRLPRERRQRIIHLFPAVPEFMTLAAFRVREPDGPWLRSQWDQGEATLGAGPAQEDNLFTIGRPAWRKIAIGAGRDVAHCAHSAFAVYIHHDNQAMVAAIGFEREVLAVRR